MLGLRWQRNRLDGASFPDGHVVFLRKVGRIHLIVVEHHFLVCFLLLGCVVHGVVPVEVDSFEREAVADHVRQQLIVHHITDGVAVCLDEVLEDFEVRF